MDRAVYGFASSKAPGIFFPESLEVAVVLALRGKRTNLHEKYDHPMLHFVETTVTCDLALSTPAAHSSKPLRDDFKPQPCPIPPVANLGSEHL